jgi:hypothetical protein
MIRDYHFALRLPNAAPRDINSVKNWINGTGCIARAESQFLEEQDDMMNLGGTTDHAVTYIEIVAETIAFGFAARLRKVRQHAQSYLFTELFTHETQVKFLPEAMKPGRSDLTQDTHLFFPGSLLRSFSRAVTSCVSAGLLLAPVIILFCVRNALWRLVVITTAVVFFLSALSMWTKARTIEIVTAGAR